MKTYSALEAGAKGPHIHLFDFLSCINNLCQAVPISGIPPIMDIIGWNFPFI